MKKKLALLGLTSLLALSTVTTAFAGQWKLDHVGWWWQEDDGSYPVNSWKEINGKWYHFDEVGYMETGWKEYTTPRRSYTWDGNGYILLSNGGSGTKNEWYYLLPSGEMLAEGNWEGGCIISDGSLFMDETWYNGGLLYQRKYANLPAFMGTPKEYNGEYGVYSCAIPWKNELAGFIYENTGDGNKTYNLQFQLPENWEQDCPTPLLSNMIGSVVKQHINTIDGRVSYTYSVDEDYVLHMNIKRYTYSFGSNNNVSTVSSSRRNEELAKRLGY